MSEKTIVITQVKGIVMIYRAFLYIGQHPQEYQSLISYGEYTLDYCYNLFAKGGQTGLEGQIMAAACRDILEVKGIKLNTIQYNSGQDWYNAVKDKWPSINIK